MKKNFGKISFIVLDIFILGFFGLYLALNLRGNDSNGDILIHSLMANDEGGTSNTTPTPTPTKKTPQITGSGTTMRGGTMGGLSFSAAYNGTAVSGSFSCSSGNENLLRIEHGNCGSLQANNVTADTSVTVTVTFSPTDTTNYNTATKYVTVNISAEACPDGERLYAGACAKCDAGTYGTGGKCDGRCPAGTTCPKGSTSASACVASQDTCFCNPTGTGCEFRRTNANNWVPIAGITDAATCTTYASNNQTACFTNGTDYSWRSVADGWTIVPGVGTQEACESMHYTDPTSGKYSLSCPKNQLKVGDTMVCTYTTDTDSPLASAHVSSNNISASVSGNKITVKGERLGGGGVYGKAQNGNATNNVQVAVVEEYSSDSCSISISTSSVHTSQTNDDVDNDYYIVNVVISGNGCNGGTANFTASNAKSVTPSTLSLANMGASKVTTFKVYPIACRQSRAHATVSYANGTKTASSNYTQNVEILGDWKKVSGTFCETNPSYTDFMSADAAGSNVYFSDRKTCADGTTVGYTVKWTRGGCGGTTTETDKCYKDKQTGLFVCGKYASQTSRYTYIADDCNSNACKNPTEPVKACYKNKETGKYKYDLKDNLPTPVENWVYVDLDETHCKDKEETPACYYIDETGKYAWGLFEDVAGYIKTTLTREQCVNPEPVTGCYKNLKTNEFAWGDYDDDNNYEYIESITAKEKCKSACFKCKDDEYLWGGYDEYGNKCELVPNIITPDSCKPVPPTAATISKIVYALSLFLVMAGTGIIVYQLTKTKKTLD